MVKLRIGGCQKKETGSLDLETQMTVSHLVGARNQIQILWKSSQLKPPYFLFLCSVKQSMLWGREGA